MTRSENGIHLPSSLKPAVVAEAPALLHLARASTELPPAPIAETYNSFDEPTSEFQRSIRTLPIPIRELLAGAITGGIGKTCIAPLERLKILYQTGRFPMGAPIAQSLRSLTKKDGVRGLFRGNSASVARIVPYSAIHFGSFEYYRRGIMEVERKHGLQLPSVADGVAGSMAGFTAVVTTYPLDVVRARLAIHVETPSTPSSSSSSSSASSAATPAPPSGASGTSRTLGGTLASSAAAAADRAASGAGASSSSPPSPPLPLRSPLSPPRPPPKPPSQEVRGLGRMLVHMAEVEGVRGLYRGIVPTLVGIVPYSGIKFFVYQGLKRVYVKYTNNAAARDPPPHLLSLSSPDDIIPPVPPPGRRKQLPIEIMLACGAAAGLIGQTVAYPFDLIRRRMQVQGIVAVAPDGQPQFTSTWQGLVVMWRHRGLRSLFAGVSINYLKVVPSTAVGFTIYDSLKSYLGLHNRLTALSD